MNVSAHRSRRPAAPKAGLPLTCGISLLIGAGTALLLLLIAACITYAQADPAQTALPAAMTVL